MLRLFDIPSDAASLRLSVHGTAKPLLPITTGSTAKARKRSWEDAAPTHISKKGIKVRSFPAPALWMSRVWLPLLPYFSLFAVALTRNIHREAGLSFTCWWMCDPQKQISTDSLLYRVQPSGNHS